MAGPALAILAGLLGRGAEGFIGEEERVRKAGLEQREQARREEETAFQREQGMFQRGQVAMDATLKTLSELPNIPVGLRPVFVDSMFDTIKRLGGKPDKALRDILVTQAETFGPAYQRSLETGQLDPLIAGMDLKIVESVKKDIESARKIRARKGAAEGVGKLPIVGAGERAGVLREGVEPAEAGFAAIPAFPPTDAANITGPELQARAQAEINWRESVVRADAAGAPRPPRPGTGIEGVPSNIVLQWSRGVDPQSGLNLTVTGARQLGRQEPAVAPIPGPPPTPAGAGTSGGGLPQRGGTAPSDLPPPNLFKNQSLRDPETKKIWRSDGTKWSEVR